MVKYKKLIIQLGAQGYPFADNTKVNNLTREKNNLVNKVRDIRTLLRSPFMRLKLRRRPGNNPNIIQFYDQFIEHNNNNRGSYVLLWQKYFENNLDNDKNLVMLSSTNTINYRLNNIDIFNARRSEFNFLVDNSGIFHQSADIAEKYFKSPKYLESNELLVFIKDVLIHMTQNIICYNFEAAIRKAIFRYLYNRSANPNLNDITRIINNIFISVSTLRRPIQGRLNTMQNILYYEVAEELVKNSSKIFKNRAEELNYSESSIKEILSNYVSLIEISSTRFEKDSELMKNLNYIIDYFNGITTTIIYNWHVTIENYLRFVINQNRAIKTFRLLYR